MIKCTQQIVICHIALQILFHDHTRIVVDAQCPPVTSKVNPRFQIDPVKVISNFDGRYTSVKCCVDGYMTLTWFFRKLNTSIWKVKKIGVNTSDRDRSLNILRPTSYIDTGFYLCLAQDQHLVNVSRSIFVYFLNVDQTKNIQLKNKIVSPKTRFYPGSEVTFQSTVETLEPLIPVHVTWWHLQGDKMAQIHREHKIDTVTITVANRSEETNPDLVEVTSHLTLSNLNFDDDGNYACLFVQNNTQVEERFLLSVHDDRIKWPLLIALVICTVALFSLGIIVWTYHNDIIIIYKSYFDPCPAGLRRVIDISVVYGDRDNESTRIAMGIVDVLEKSGFRCWFYDRDKKFGGDIFEDYVRAMSISHVLLIILSSNSSELITSFSSLQQNPGVRRLFLFIPNKKSIYCLIRESVIGAERWLTQELQLQTLFQKNSIDLENIMSVKDTHHHVAKWIMTFIPSMAIRNARWRLSKEIR